MNKQEKYMDDLLKQYVIPDRFEKAPDGFTAKVMTRVHLDTQSVTTASKNLVPLISVLVTILFLAAALLIPDSQTNNIAQPIAKILDSIKTMLPSVNFNSLLSFSIPAVSIYVLIGILFLTLFDKALHGIFKKGE